VLAGVLKGCADVERALREYESRRYRRARFVVTESRRIGWMGQFEGRLTAALRDVMLRAIPRFVNEWQHQRYFSLGL
jgi:2-polyprenyl-6-methoxyphenol hydroxylase-like FAD-dependent oxidoreductase